MTHGNRRDAAAQGGEVRAPRVRAKRELGQHFLVSSSIIQRISDTCVRLSSGASGVLEIGPGTGALTSRLQAFGLPLWAVEADRVLAESLGGSFPSARIVSDDARAIDLERLSVESGLARWLVVGNLPYNAGTDILKRMLRYRRRVSAIVVMLQKEVAGKFCADTGDKAYGALGAWTAVWWESTLEFTVKPGAFRPQPKVTSAVCAFKPKAAPTLPDESMDGFQAFLSKAFAHPRKTLKRNLGRDVDVRDPLMRPSDLSSEEFVRLFLRDVGKS